MLIRLMLALAVMATMSLQALAQDAKAAAPAAKPAAAAKSAKAPAPKKEVKAEITGKITTKKVTNKKTGKEVEAAFITVASAKGADGKALDNLKGKELRIQGHKGLDLKSHIGKDATITGTVVNDHRVVVESVK